MSIIEIDDTKRWTIPKTIKDMDQVNYLQLSPSPLPSPSRKQARHNQGYKIFKEQIRTTLYKLFQKEKKDSSPESFYMYNLGNKAEQVG